MSRRGDRGTGTLEWILVTPVLFLFVLLIVQFGLYFHAAHVVTAAAQEGARTARVETGTAAAGKARAEDFLNDAGAKLLKNSTVRATRDDDTATVSIEARVVAVVPGMTLPVKAVSTGPVERVSAEGE